MNNNYEEEYNNKLNNITNIILESIKQKKILFDDVYDLINFFIINYNNIKFFKYYINGEIDMIFKEIKNNFLRENEKDNSLNSDEKNENIEKWIIANYKNLEFDNEFNYLFILFNDTIKNKFGNNISYDYNIFKTNITILYNYEYSNRDNYIIFDNEEVKIIMNCVIKINNLKPINDEDTIIDNIINEWNRNEYYDEDDDEEDDEEEECYNDDCDNYSNSNSKLNLFSNNILTSIKNKTILNLNNTDVTNFVYFFYNNYYFISFIEKNINKICNKIDSDNKKKKIIEDFIINRYNDRQTEDDTLLINTIKNETNITVDKSTINNYFYDYNYSIDNIDNFEIINNYDNIWIIIKCLSKINNTTIYDFICNIIVLDILELNNIKLKENDSGKDDKNGDVKENNPNSILDNENKSREDNFIIQNSEDKTLNNLKAENDKLNKTIVDVIKFLKNVKEFLERKSDV
jgi:hypothetical protein